LWFLFNNHWSLACLGICLAASLMGFLRFNFSQNNKIFMGDTGSLIIGYIITVLAVKYIHYNVNHSFNSESFVSAPIIAIVILIVPIFDTLRVFSIRIIRGRSPFKADRIHLHHLLVDNNLSHLNTSLILYLGTVFLTTLTYLGRTYFSNTEMCLFIVTFFVVYILIGNWLEAKRFKLKKEELSEKINKEEIIKIKETISSN
jgi:UDP-N-acetylmuramyl pentapeptide phosphotransferase/UDP-N-acetylglucosamine-1-phosphate transferase